MSTGGAMGAAPTNTTPQGQATSLGFTPGPYQQGQQQGGMSPVQMQEQQRYQQGMATGDPYAGTGGPGLIAPTQQASFTPTYEDGMVGPGGQQSTQPQQMQAQQRAPQYQPQYRPQQRAPQYQQQMPNYQSGLQAALMNMMQQYSRPAMRAPMQQGLSPYNYAMNYRPNPAPAQQNLGRTATTMQPPASATPAKTPEQEADDAAFARWQRSQYEASKNPAGSGGG